MKKLFLHILLFQCFFANCQIYSTNLYNIDTCNFDQLCTNLSIDTSSFNLWKIGNPHKIIFNSIIDDDKVIVTDTILNYPINNTSKFTYKSYYNLINSYNFNISFKHRIDSDTLKDGGFVELSIDNGQNWYNVIDPNMPFQYQYSASENFYSTSDSLVNNNFGFSGYSSDWIISKYQWIITNPLRKEINDTLLFRFNFISDSIENNREGWMIDDFKIQQYTPIDGIYENTISFINVIPNPASTTIKFENNNFEILDLKIYDISNKIIQCDQVSKNEIDINNLKSGLYYLRIETKSTINVSKFIKE
jgi:hypothetical protein